MKNVFKKKIITILIFCILISGSLFAQTSIALNAGSVNNIFFYDQNGVLIRDIDSSRISFDKTLIIKSGNYKAVFTYKYGKIILSENTIIAIEFSQSNFKFYLIDGNVNISANQSASNKVTISTPVTEYKLDPNSDISVYSNKEKESFALNLGTAIVYNSITGKKYRVHENNKMNLNSSESVAYTELEKFNSRDTFANTDFPYGIKPIVKSNDDEDFLTINIIATGNGQGNNGELDFASLKGLLNEADRYNEKYLLIDAGNTLAGSLYVNFDKGNTANQLLDKIGYDIFVPGSIDFSYGIDQLKKLDNESNVNFISTNALDNNKYNIFKPYQLYAFNDFRIAVFGLSNPSDLTNLQDVNFDNQIIIDNAQKAIDEANKFADYVILVSNYDSNDINPNIIANSINGIDLIIDGSQSLAYTTKRNNTTIVSTGVGYSKIINTQLSTYKDNLLNVIPSIVHSTNVKENTTNNLSNALNIKSFERDEDIDKFFSNIQISDDYSRFLVPPIKDHINYSIIKTSLPPKSITNTVKKQNNIAKPTIKSFVIRKQGSIDINSSTALVIEELNKVPSAPVFVNTKSEIILNEDIEESQDIVIEDNTKVAIVNSVEDKPIYQEIISDSESNSSISFGLKTKLSSDLVFTNFNFNIQTPLEAKLKVVPYFDSTNFSIALNLNMDFNGSNFSFNAYPLPSTNTFKTSYPFIMNLIEYFKINSTNGLVNFNFEKGSFDSPVESPLVLNQFGSNSTLAFKANYESSNSNLTLFLSDATLTPYFNNKYESAGLFRTSRLSNNLFALTYGTLAKIKENSVNLYPILSSEINFVYNANLEVGLNINSALYLPAQPFDLTKLINNTGNDLLPNYIIGASLKFRFNDLRLSAGATYEVHESGIDFTTNMFHKDYIRSSLLVANESNTISPNVRISYNNSKADFYINYSIPYNFTASEIKNDLLDMSLSINNDSFNYGIYYIQNNLINHIKNFSSIKSFLYNNEVEFGLNLGYIFNNYFKTSLNLGLPNDITAPLKISLNVNLNLDKNI